MPAGYNSSAQMPAAFWEIDLEQILHLQDGHYYEILLDMFFNARHYIIMDGHAGPLHAHSYRLQVVCRSDSLVHGDDVIVGYQQLRQQVEMVIRAYNNQLLNDLPPFEHLQPTTESLVAVLFQQLQRALSDLPARLTSLTVWESPTEAVTYGGQ